VFDYRVIICKEDVFDSFQRKVFTSGRSYVILNCYKNSVEVANNFEDLVIIPLKERSTNECLSYKFNWI